MEPGMIWEWVIKSLVILLAMTAGFAYLTLYERRGIGQDCRPALARTGPVRMDCSSRLRMRSS